jgi:anti-anti-sigma factor
VTITIEDMKSGAVVIADIRGRLDGVTAPELDQKLTALAGNGARLVLDLSGLDYVSSAGLRIFLKAAKQIKANKGRLALAGITPTVTKIFEISGFTTIFDIYSDRDAAVAALS